PAGVQDGKRIFSFRSYGEAVASADLPCRALGRAERIELLSISVARLSSCHAGPSRRDKECDGFIFHHRSASPPVHLLVIHRKSRRVASDTASPPNSGTRAIEGAHEDISREDGERCRRRDTQWSRVQRCWSKECA